MIDLENSDDHILVDKGDVFDGTRFEFSTKVFPNPTDDEIIQWCIESGFNLSINGKKIV
jgi:hypothetical protein